MLPLDKANHRYCPTSLLLPQSIPMWPPVWWIALVWLPCLLINCGRYCSFIDPSKLRLVVEKHSLPSEQHQGIGQDKACILLCHEMIVAV